MSLIPPKNNEAGFSLVEAVLVAALIVVVFVVFAAVFGRVSKNVSSLNERGAQNNEAGLLADMIDGDLQRAGDGLTFSTKSAFSGQAPVSFEPNSNYEVGGGTVLRYGSSDSLLLSSLLWRGRGELHFNGSAFSVSVRDVTDSSKSRTIASDSRFLSVLENGQQVHFQMFRTGQSTFQIKVDSIMADGTERCRTSYLVDGQVMYESLLRCLENPLEVAVWLPDETKLYDVGLTGSELAYRSDGVFAVRDPLLPYYRGARLASFVVSDSRGFVVIAGAGGPRADLHLIEPTDFYPEKESRVQVVEETGLAPGDLLLLCDYANQRSVLLNVLEADGTSIVVQPRLLGRYDVPVGGGKGKGDDFAEFYSLESDFEGFTFDSGSRLVKLSPPVEYKVSTKDQTPGLFRRLGSGPWELLAPNVENFLFAERASSGLASFEVSLDVLSEGVENGRTILPVRVSVSPRSLNRTFDAR
jgi:hypothetical protein